MINRTATPHGIRSWLDYRYRGKRYRPVLGYNLTPDQERDEQIRVLAAIHANVGTGETAGLNFAASAGKYLMALAARNLKAPDRPTTIITRHLVPFFAVRPLASLKLEDGIAYIAHRRSQQAADGTIQRECGVLLALLNYAVDNEDLDRNRLSKLPVPKGEKRERVAQGWELYRLYHAAGPALQSMIGLALMTLLRESKLIEMHAEWRIRRSDGDWLIPASYLVSSMSNLDKPHRTLSINYTRRGQSLGLPLSRKAGDVQDLSHPAPPAVAGDAMREEGSFKFDYDGLLIQVQAALDAAYAEGLRDAAKQVPTNWCDELLSGKTVSKLPWNSSNIEQLLRGVQQRIERLAQQAEGGVHGTSEHE